MLLVTTTINSQALVHTYSFDSTELSKLNSKLPGWGQDTMVLRYILDSNGYKGSCLSFITSIVSNSPDPQASPNPLNDIYRIKEIQISNKPWLKKITNNIIQLDSLSVIIFQNDTNFIYITGFNSYLKSLTVNNSAISSLNFDPSFLQELTINHCKNLISFSYNLKNMLYLNLTSNKIEDISNLMLGDRIQGTSIDSNNIHTIPVPFVLQKIQSSNSKIAVNYNFLGPGCASTDIITLLNQIADDPSWESKQKPCTSVISKIKRVYTYKINNKKIYNILGRTISKSTSNQLYTTKNTVNIKIK
jgi:hypothetical protein